MRRSLSVPWLAFILAAVTFAGQDNTPTVVSLAAPPGQVGRYDKLELTIEVGRKYIHPFDPCEVQLDVLITEPSGRSLVALAFWGQDYERTDLMQRGKPVAWCYPQGTGSWKVRLTPTELGRYVLRASLTDREGQVFSSSVTFECVASPSRGFLQAGREDPRFFEFSDGQPFFAIGQNLAFIGQGQYVTIPKAEEIFGKLARNGANFLRIWTCCEDWALAIEARKSAWVRSWTKDSPIVAMPGSEGESPRRCVQLKGQDGDPLAPGRPAARHSVCPDRTGQNRGLQGPAYPDRR
ncbi:MAG TPA: hypothetical protein VLI39_10260 [Sedimentisphaerales bacterium]|nr:hypothetical protein [Sedimentisphaerales bacterium]